MDSRQQRTLVMFESVFGFLDRHPLAPEPPLLTRKRRMLAAVHARVRELQVAQIIAAHEMSSAHLESARRHMRRDVLMPLVRVLKPIFKFAPGMERLLHVPHGRADTATIAAHALELARALKPHARLLASAGYPPGFVVQFTREAQLLAAAATRSERARQRGATATITIRREIAKGMATVGVIEGMVMRLIIPGNPVAASLWQRARRVPARTGRPRTSRPRAPRRAPDAAVPDVVASIPDVLAALLDESAAPRSSPPELQA